MPRIKRALRHDGDDAPTEGTPSAPTSPSAGKTGKRIPYTKWFIGLGAFLLVIIGLPSLIWAQTQSVQVNPSSITALQQKIAEVQTMVQSIIGGSAFTNQVPGGLNSLSSSCTSRGCLNCRSDRNRNKCVNQCIWGADGILACVALVSNQNVTEDTTTELFSPISLKVTMAQAYTPTYASCITAGNSCLTSCEADMPCEDRAAAWFDACISWVEKTFTDPVKNAAAKAKCGQIDRQLILKYCGAQGAMVESNLAPDFCTDQCCRVQGICSSSMPAYSMYHQDMCQKLGDQCRTQSCPGSIPVCKYDSTLCSAYLEKAKAGDAAAREQLKQCTHCQIGCTDAQLTACSDSYKKSAEADVPGVDAMMTSCLSTCSWPSGGQCTTAQVTMCNDTYKKYAETGIYSSVNLNDMKNMCLRDCAWPTTGCTMTQLDLCRKNLEAGPKIVTDKYTLYAYQAEYDSCIQSCTWPTVSCQPGQVAMCEDSYNTAIKSASPLVNSTTYDTQLQECYKTCQWSGPKTSTCSTESIAYCQKAYPDVTLQNKCLTEAGCATAPTTGTTCNEQQLADCQMWNENCLATTKSTDKCAVVHANCQASCQCTYDQLKSCYGLFAGSLGFDTTTYLNCTASCAPKMFQTINTGPLNTITQ